MNVREILSGRTLALGIGLALGLTTLPATAAGIGDKGGNRALTLRRQDAGVTRVRGYWTPERLRAVRPLPLNQVQAFDANETDESEAAASAVEAGAPASAPGQRPLPGIRPLLSNRLFEKSEIGTPRSVTGRAAGSAKGYFTSHRLIPEDADLEFPYRTVGIVLFTIPGEGDFYCSAAVLRRRLVVTAGQCLHEGSGGNNGFFENFLFVPAYRDGVAPYSTWEWAAVTVPTTWSTGNGRLPNAADYGFLEVEDQVYNGSLRKLGDVVGFLGYVIKKLRPNHATLLGYPTDFDQGELMHQVSAKDLRAAAQNTAEFGSDMRGGSAGGPILQDFGDNPNTVKLIGVISYGSSAAPVKTQGASIPDNRFTSLLNAACADRAGNC
jgi:V8-like Glu-specific endopeptidase